MKVHVYEKWWMIGSVVMIVAFMGAILVTSFAMGIHPPSHVEMINPSSVYQDARFATRGVRPAGAGVQVVMIASMWQFDPPEVHVPAGVPVTFRITSPDVIHGFEVVGTNVNSMVVPGYVSQLTMTFEHPGDYLLLCNEYCGVGHHTMQGKLVVTGGAR